MVEDAHGEDGVEGRQGGREVFDAEGQDEGWCIRKVLAHGEVLHDVEEEGVDAEGEAGAFGCHAPAVVAVAAADIEHEAAGEGGDAVAESVPLEIGAPFGVDLGAEEVEGAFAPRAEAMEGVWEGGALGGGEVGGLADLDGGGVEVGCAGAYGGEGVEGFEPGGEVAIVGVGEGRAELGAKGRDPWGEAGGGE